MRAKTVCSVVLVFLFVQVASQVCFSASSAGGDLSARTQRILAGLQTPVHLRVIRGSASSPQDLQRHDQLLALLKKFQAASDRVRIPTADQVAVKVPELKGTPASAPEPAEHATVAVEAGGKTEVVPFQQLWPLRPAAAGTPPGGLAGEDRAFNAESAIASRILCLTGKPVATVLLAHWRPGPDTPPQIARMIPPSEIPLESLGAIRKRLEESNVRVVDWNLRESIPDPNDAKDRPKVLLVLPVAPEVPRNPIKPASQPAPRFQPQHAEKVVAAIGKGMPAIFLTTFSPPQQMSMFTPPASAAYVWNPYLREAWGLEALTDYLVIPAVSDEKTPGNYKVDGQRFSYLPLANFSDQPIGKPLQAQRVLWANLCPVMPPRNARGEPAAPPAGVTIQPLLSVPADWKSTWATRRIQDLLAQFQNTEGSHIRPDYEAGDLPAPFDVGVAATRAEDKAKGLSPARIVVLCEGQSLMDGYLDRQVAMRDAKGAITLTDPPSVDADLIVNSVYWLIGREDLIPPAPPAGGR